MKVLFVVLARIYHIHSRCSYHFAISQIVLILGSACLQQRSAGYIDVQEKIG